MVKVALRVYNNEISDLIDSGQVNEAIAHCLHILELFPRHVDTYRLLGKAYLESKQYRDAVDIFHRVLSSIPDDFISNVGMSIIREVEGDLQASIYHMERTFERQPSNQAIQEELRRLYGKRDGIKPAKTRLTRGALARMYAHGNLYDQAAAELVAALSEEPQRLDLQVLLADLYYKLNKFEDAVEICTHILSILPNSIDANRILYLVLKDGPRKEEAAEYHKRWSAMEPYAAFASDGQSPLETIPDSMVTLNRLELASEQFDFGELEEIDWATQGGEAGGAAAASDDIPDWLKTSEEKEAGFAPSAAQAEEDEPDWLSGLGGIEREIPEERSSIVKDEKAPSDETADAGDVPSWLTSDQPKETAKPAQIEKASLLDRLEPTAGDIEPPGKGTHGPVEIGSEEKSLDEMLSTAGSPPADEMDIAETPTDKDVPDWMEGFTEGQESHAGAAEDEISLGSEAPDWLQELKPEKDTEEDLLDGDSLNWLDEPVGKTKQVAEDSSAWLLQPAGEQEFTELSRQPDDKGLAEETAPDWMQQSAVDDVGDDIDLPDWMQELDNEENQVGVPTWMQKPAEEVGQVEDEETSEWMKGLDKDSVEQPPAIEEIPSNKESVEETEDLDEPTKDLDWLGELGEPQHEPESSDSSQDTWQSLFQDIDDVHATPPAQPMKTAFIDEAEDDEDPLSWLNDLPSTSDLPSETEPVEDEMGGKQEEAPYNPSDLGGAETLAMEIEAETQPSDIPGADDLDWIDKMLTKDDKESTAPESSTQAQNPSDSEETDEYDWLSALTEEESNGEGLDQTVKEDPQLEQEENVPAEGLTKSEEFEWIETPDQKTAEKESASGDEDWLRSLLEEDESSIISEVESKEKEDEDFQAETTIESESEYSVLEEQSPEEWLESFEEEADTEVNPDLDEESLDWMDDLEFDEPQAGSDGPDPAEASSPTIETKTVLQEIEQQEEEPDWLKSIDDEEEGDKPNWLKNLNQPGKIEGQTEDTPTDEVDEWLKYLSESVASPPAESTEFGDASDISQEQKGEEHEKASDEETSPSPEAKEKNQADVPETSREEIPPVTSSADLDETIKKYSYMIRKGRDLEQIVENLQDALKQHPMDARLWQILGDAYMRLDNLKEALDAYTQAENLLR